MFEIILCNVIITHNMSQCSEVYKQQCHAMWTRRVSGASIVTFIDDNGVLFLTNQSLCCLPNFIFYGI